MIPVSELSNLLPHRDKMVWIDAVIEAGAEGGKCLVKVDPEKHYYSPEGVRQSALIEWMAQGYGFVCAQNYRSVADGRKLEKAFLVGVDRMTMAAEMPQAGEEIVVELKMTRQIGPVSYVEGKIFHRTQLIVYGEAQIKLFSI